MPTYARAATSGPHTSPAAGQQLLSVAVPTATPMRRLDVRGLIASTGTASVALLAAAVSLAGAGAASSLTIASFSLQPAGIVFALHPTAAPIAIIATAAAPLAVCQFSTSFAGAWKGGCRRLGHRPLLLPSSGGGLHIGFRAARQTGGRRESPRCGCAGIARITPSPLAERTRRCASRPRPSTAGSPRSRRPRRAEWPSAAPANRRITRRARPARP